MGETSESERGAVGGKARSGGGARYVVGLVAVMAIAQLAYFAAMHTVGVMPTADPTMTLLEKAVDLVVAMAVMTAVPSIAAVAWWWYHE